MSVIKPRDPRRFWPLALLCLCGQAQAEQAQQLETMTILGPDVELPRTVGSAHRLDEEQLRAFAYDDINRSLNAVPGLYIREEDGFGLRPNIGLRGANSDRSQKITLMEDGVLFGPAPYAAPAAYYFPLSARMSGIEVFKGPAAIAYGPQTIGGALNLLSTPLPQETSARLALDAGSDGYRRALAGVGGQSGAFGWLAEGVYVGSDGFKQLEGGGDTGFDKAEFLLKGGLPLAGGRLQLRVGYASETSHETYLGLTEADFRSNSDLRYLASSLDRMDWDWNGVRADYSRAVVGGQWQITAYQHRFSRAWNKFNNLRGVDIRSVLANPDTPGNRLFYQSLRGQIDTDPNLADDDLLIGTNDRDFRSSGVQSSWQRDFAGPYGQHALALGLRVHSDRIDRLHDELAYETAAGQLQRNAAPRAITADNTGRAQAVSIWLRDEWQYGRLSLVPGLRIESVEVEFSNRLVGARGEDRYTELLPGIGLNFAQNERLSWLAGLHRGFSPASPGLTPAEPETALNAEAGARWRSPIGRLELIGFFSDYRNLTAVCTFSSGCDDAQIGQQTNAGRVRVAGLEFVLHQEFALGQQLAIPVNLQYTLTEGEFRESFQSSNPQFGDVEAGFELPYVPRHRVYLSLGLAGPNWQLLPALSYVSAMRDQAGRGRFDDGSDAYTVLDLAARWEFNPQWIVQARVDNLLDREYVVARRPFGARPGKPLSLQLGLEYRFNP